MIVVDVSESGADPGFCVRGTKVGEGSGDRLRSPAVAKPPPEARGF